MNKFVYDAEGEEKEEENPQVIARCKQNYAIFLFISLNVEINHEWVELNLSNYKRFLNEI